MTYKEFKAFGKANYCNGGDVIFECWEESDFNEYVNEFGEMTKENAENLCGMYKSVEYDL